MKPSTLSGIAQQERLRRELLQKSDLVPPLPDFVVRLLGVLNKPDTEPGDLEGYLQNDQVLVAKMLGMVNSPFYGLNRTVKTIKDAVMVLSFRGVRSLVLATSTSKFMQRDYTCYGHEAKGLWLHAACVAAGARALAKSCKLGAEAAEQLFVAGLLHDIGKMLLAPYLTEAQRRVPPSTPCTTELEQSLVGLDHTEAGALVTAKWNLSSEVQEILKQHHDGTPGETDNAAMFACVRIADQLAHEMGVGYAPGMAPQGQVDPLDLQVLGLGDADQWAATKSELIATMDLAVQALATLTN